MRAGGNMSPVAGTVEVLSLGIEAKLEQLKRLKRTYRDVAGSSARTEQIARSNWEVFNKELAAEIGQAQSYLASFAIEKQTDRITGSTGKSCQSCPKIGAATHFLSRSSRSRPAGT